MSEVKFLVNVRGDHGGHSPVNPEPGLERQIVREIEVLTGVA